MTIMFFCCSHAIVSSTTGPEYYVAIYSFVDKTQLEPGCSVLLHNKVCYCMMLNFCAPWFCLVVEDACPA